MDVAQILDEVADLPELQSANPFRVRAYRTVAGTIRHLGELLATTVCPEPKKLIELADIGEDLAGKIQTIVETAQRSR